MSEKSREMVLAATGRPALAIAVLPAAATLSRLVSKTLQEGWGWLLGSGRPQLRSRGPEGRPSVSLEEG
jgi:hypothetical protein